MTRRETLQNDPLRKLFLLDGIGALLTAFFLVVPLSYFKEYIGMPDDVLIYLALVAFVFSVYSFSCFLLPIENRKPFLIAIGLGNSLYCALTLVAVFSHYASLTILGVSYFLVEMVIIGVLVSVELRAAGAQRSPRR